MGKGLWGREGWGLVARVLITGIYIFSLQKDGLVTMGRCYDFLNIL